MNDQHIDDRELIAYVLRGERPLDEETIVSVERHIAVCDTCRTRYDDMQARYDALGLMKDPNAHLAKLKDDYQRARHKRHCAIYTLSALLAAAVVFVIVSAAVNYTFNHGDRGLAMFEKDYGYALETEYYRGTPASSERPDILVLKEGIRAMFDARRYTLTFPAGYDLIKLNEADSLIARASAMSEDDLLKKKAISLRKKIEAIKSYY